MLSPHQEYASNASSRFGESTTWTYPSTCLLVPPIVLTLQSTLVFIHPSSSFYSLSSSSTFRLALLPLSLHAIWHSCSLPEGSFFHPLRDFVHLNTVIQLSKFWACMRSIEFAVADRQEYEWIGYEKAYLDNHRGKNDKPSNRGKEMTHSFESDVDKSKADKLRGIKTSEDEGAITSNPASMEKRNPILLGWLNLCSL